MWLISGLRWWSVGRCRRVDRWWHRCGSDGIRDLEGDIKNPLAFPGRLTDLVANELRGLTVAGAGEELCKRDMDLADIAIAEGTLSTEDDDDDMAGGIVRGKGEAKSGVPGWVGAAVAIRGGALHAAAVAVDGYDGVDLHLGEEVDVLEVFGGDEGDF